MDAIAADLTMAVDPLAGRPFRTGNGQLLYKLNITVVNPVVDPTFSFVTVDPGGKIRMDPSSPYAMARLIGLKDHFGPACQRSRCNRPAS
jgi:phosphoglucomutase